MECHEGFSSPPSRHEEQERGWPLATKEKIREILQVLTMLYLVQDVNIDMGELRGQPFLPIINPKVFPVGEIIHVELWNIKQHCQREGKGTK